MQWKDSALPKSSCPRFGSLLPVQRVPPCCTHFTPPPTLKTERLICSWAFPWYFSIQDLQRHWHMFSAPCKDRKHHYLTPFYRRGAEIKVHPIQDPEDLLFSVYSTPHVQSMAPIVAGETKPFYKLHPRISRQTWRNHTGRDYTWTVCFKWPLWRRNRERIHSVEQPSTALTTRPFFLFLPSPVTFSICHPTSTTNEAGVLQVSLLH